MCLIPDKVIGFLILPDFFSLIMALCFYSASKRSTRNLGGVKRSRRVRLTTTLIYMSRMSANCGSLVVLQPCGHPRSVITIILL
jgi:hypothetical protein